MAVAKSRRATVQKEESYQQEKIPTRTSKRTETWEQVLMPPLNAEDAVVVVACGTGTDVAGRRRSVCLDYWTVVKPGVAMEIAAAADDDDAVAAAAAAAAEGERQQDSPRLKA